MLQADKTRMLEMFSQQGEKVGTGRRHWQKTRLRNRMCCVAKLQEWVVGPLQTADMTVSTHLCPSHPQPSAAHPQVEFETPVDAKGNIEVWLQRLVDGMQNTIKQVIKRAVRNVYVSMRAADVGLWWRATQGVCTTCRTAGLCFGVHSGRVKR